MRSHFVLLAALAPTLAAQPTPSSARSGVPLRGGSVPIPSAMKAGVVRSAIDDRPVVGAIVVASQVIQIFPPGMTGCGSIVLYRKTGENPVRS